MGPARRALSWRLSTACAALALAARVDASGKPLKGIAYGPFPSKQHGAPIHLDDFMSDAAKPLWGPRGRADLQTMQGMGANAVRLYGNDPKLSHTEFLDEANSLGMHVIPGMSDFPYIQMVGNCMQTAYDCYSQLKEQYLQNLRHGFLLPDGNYHPALLHLIIINEPDLKLPSIASPDLWCKAIISAVDGMLDAEKEAGAKGRLIPFTVTFSFAVCAACKSPQSGKKSPALDQMLELREAFLHPEAYYYSPKNDLSAFYWNRFLNSFNTQNSAPDLQRLFFDGYKVEFPNTEVSIEEFHSRYPPIDNKQDLDTLYQMVNDIPQLIGANFFEFQVRYDKGGKERGFGMFGLGDYRITEMQFFGETYSVWCLSSVTNAKTSQPVSAEVAAAYGGHDVDFQTSCIPDASKVALNEQGFNTIKGLDVNARATYVQRLVEHLGGEASTGQAWGFAGGITGQDYNSVVAQLRQKPGWATWRADAACVADRQSSLATVGQVVNDWCKSNGFWFKCQVMQEADFPEECKSGWNAADYVFSVYFNQFGGNPLENCYEHGAAIYASPSYYRSRDTHCVVTMNPSTTTLTDEGFQAIIKQTDKAKNKIFFQRVIREKLGAMVVSDAELDKFAGTPPSSMYDLTTLLKDALWTCGGATGRRCGATVGLRSIGWVQWAFVGIGSVVALSVLCASAYVRCKRPWIAMERRISRCLPASWQVDTKNLDDASSEDSS